MQSLEKIRDHLDELLGPPSSDPTPLELTMRTVVGLAAPALESVLPEDPAQLDEFLEHAAAKILELRSDGAPVGEGFLLKVIDVVEQDGAHLGEEFAQRIGKLWHDVVSGASAQNSPVVAQIAAAANNAPDAGLTTAGSVAPEPVAPEPDPEGPAVAAGAPLAAPANSPEQETPAPSSAPSSDAPPPAPPVW